MFGTIFLTITVYLLIELAALGAAFLYVRKNPYKLHLFKEAVKKWFRAANAHDVDSTNQNLEQVRAEVKTLRIRTKRLKRVLKENGISVNRRVRSIYPS